MEIVKKQVLSMQVTLWHRDATLLDSVWPALFPFCLEPSSRPGCGAQQVARLSGYGPVPYVHRLAAPMCKPKPCQMNLKLCN
jgi:hypothetical protein